MIMNQLAESLSNSLDNQCKKALAFTEDNDYANAGAILNEWTIPPKNGCLLTHFMAKSLDTVEEQLLYVSFKNDTITYGTLSFVPATQLPTDNI